MNTSFFSLCLLFFFGGIASAGTCVDEANRAKLPLETAVRKIQACEHKARAECNKVGAEKKQSFVACVDSTVGDKSFLKTLAPLSCNKKVETSQAQGKELANILKNCEIEATSTCARAASDLGLSAGSAERFVSHCKRAAAGLFDE